MECIKLLLTSLITFSNIIHIHLHSQNKASLSPLKFRKVNISSLYFINAFSGLNPIEELPKASLYTE